MMNALDVKRKLENILNFTRGAHSVAGFAARDTLGQIIEAIDRLVDEVSTDSVSEATQDIDIDSIPLAPRAKVNLIRHGFTTLNSLAEKTESEILKIKGIGGGSLETINDYLHKYGLRLKDE